MKNCQKVADTKSTMNLYVCSRQIYKLILQPVHNTCVAFQKELKGRLIRL